MNFTLAVVALFSVLGRADAALRNSNAPVPNESESERKLALAECEDPKCEGWRACSGIDQSKVGCGSCNAKDACSTAIARTPTIIGNNSCNALYSCFGATGYIPDNQCNSARECNYKHFPAPALSQYKDNFFTGQCQSSDGELYSGGSVHIMIPLLTENSPEACAQFCRQPSFPSGQVGMQFGNDECSCLYDGIGELPLSSLLPEGPIASGNLEKDWRCYPLKDENVTPPSLNEPT